MGETATAYGFRDKKKKTTNFHPSHKGNINVNPLPKSYVNT